jgi:hypothetical protein
MMGMVDSAVPTVPTDRLPTPAELHAFLRTHYGLDCFDPGKPVSFWSEFSIASLPFTDGMVQELRGPLRKQLRSLSPGNDPPAIVDARRHCLVGSPVGECPTSDDLFQVAGANVWPGLRMRVCLRMVGITQGDADLAVNPNHPDEGALSEFLNHPGKDYAHLGALCTLLDVNQDWIERGPRSFPLEGNPTSPWWLAPWCEAQRLCMDVLDPLESAGVLVFLAEADPPRYDLLGLWRTWHKDPAQFPLPPAPPDKEFGLLPWLFAGGIWYRTGDPTLSITLTKPLWHDLLWIISFYQRSGMALLERDSVPADQRPSGPAPTGQRVLELLTRLHTPPVANPRLEAKTSPGASFRLTPQQAPAPTRLPSDAVRERAGKRPGRPPGSKNKQPKASGAKRSTGKNER